MKELSHSIVDGVVTLHHNGARKNKFDFESAGFNKKISACLARAFVSEFGHTTLEAQRQSWRCLRKFGLFLKECNIEQNQKLPIDILNKFRDWLQKSELANSTSQSILNATTIIISWCDRNTPEILSNGTNISIAGFIREEPKRRPNLSEEEIKAILSACYSDIEEVERTIRRGQRILSNSPESLDEESETETISKLLELGGGDIPKLREIFKSKKGLGTKTIKLGGTRSIVRMLWITPEDLLPFFVAITAQTSGNPYSILELTRDCIRKHPLRTDIERIVWEKHRSHSEQHADFPTGKKWSAPELCRMLMSLNNNLIVHCAEYDRDKLFISKRSSRKVGQAKFQMMHILLDQFIERHKLPNFDFKDLRRAGAVLHHKATGSVVSAQKRLNHLSPVTTARYTSINAESNTHNAIIRRFQGKLVQAARSGEETIIKKPQNPDESNQTAYETTFGFLCSDPFSGTAPGSVNGSACLQFHKCATCPGALIPLDDLSIVSRLLSTRRYLIETKARSIKEGWWQRFKEIYEPTLLILNEDLLPKIAPSTKKMAESIREEHRLFKLE